MPHNIYLNAGLIIAHGQLAGGLIIVGADGKLTHPAD
jgi:hypothetical protein